MARVAVAVGPGHRIGWKRAAVLAVLVLVGVPLFIDTVFVVPCGFLSYHRLVHRRSWAHPPYPCGWDYEGEWQIGWARGKSPEAMVLANSTRAAITCAHVRPPEQPVSFVADPFLVLPRSGAGAWHVFYESKNIVRGLGEIGVARSVDNGATWAHVGTALTEPHHLSYPWVEWDASVSAWRMVPEGGTVAGVRVYETSEQQFPLGWRQVATIPLPGNHWADASPVLWRGTWYVFAQQKSRLRLFYADSLTSSDWHEHPHSPIAIGSHFSRMGGPPVVSSDGKLFRIAQDDTGAYGVGLHVFRVGELSRTEYSETLARSMWPGEHGAKWARHRLHHLCPRELSPGKWIALADGDAHRHLDQCREQEWALIFCKRALLAVLLCIAASMAWSDGYVAIGAEAAVRKLRNREVRVWILVALATLAAVSLWAWGHSTTPRAPPFTFPDE